MSEDLVNQITLNFLISKQQLYKLNKKIKQKEEDKMKTDMEIYKEQFIELFNKMVNDDFPEDLLEDVKHSYNYFVEKSIYYLKMKAETNKSVNEIEDDVENKELQTNNDDLSETNNEEEDEDEEEEDEEDEEDEDDEDEKDKEEEDLSETNEDDEDEKDKEEEDEDDLSETNNDLSETNEEEISKSKKTFTTSSTIYPKVYKKVNRPTKSKGVEDIKQLPLDWFTKVKQTNKQNSIIPRNNNSNK